MTRGSRNTRCCYVWLLALLLPLQDVAGADSTSADRARADARAGTSPKEDALALGRARVDAERALLDLTELMQQARGKNIDVSYFEAVASTCEIGRWRISESPRKPSLDEALEYCKFIHDRCKAAEAELKRILSGKQF